MLPGFGSEEHRALAEMRGSGEGELGTAMDIVEDVEGDELEWEMIPDELKVDEAFVAAVRDIVGSQ